MGSYFSILIIILISSILGIILYSLSYFFVIKEYDTEKVSAYECGFDPFTDVSQPFDVRYYLVSILFIIFDLEVSFLFPWSVAFLYIGVFGYWTMIVFLVVLTIGFCYEWVNGALDWE